MGWTASRFDLIAWDSLRDCLEGKSEMYRIWLSKQSAGVCATRSNMSRIQQSLYNKCPNCGLVEKAEHLNRCPSAERTRLLEEGVKELEEWMQQDNRTDSKIAYWLPKYILFRGSRSWGSLGTMSKQMRDIAESQDEIGWREFLEAGYHESYSERKNYTAQSAPAG